MRYDIREMKAEDYESVKRIYLEGIATKKATFQTEAPEYEAWNQGHCKECRFVAVDEKNEILGWIALSPTSSRCVYRGVNEVSIYIAQKGRGQQIGTALLSKVIEESEKLGIWTLQSGIFEINEASIALHKKCGFRVVGTRENIAKDVDGIWRNTVLMERRSKNLY
ncbi:GNAT family N-acetyltransferase [Anaerosporobacter faecicola]|uniref:GNAT family N-acetyltransferase n=1 Tax=Anaerosporobacter faecicola TaxID=2718714 RepID=UPI00143AF8E3|nr:GNAT family N-acetyltransferase [Anaerosporobacter faecicola]